MWNVKVSGSVFWGKDKDDLIETLWNVKYLAFEYHGRTIRDLIETLWNVKMEEQLAILGQLQGFNRDIVECKAF